jgi:hypothetical protein
MTVALEALAIACTFRSNKFANRLVQDGFPTSSSSLLFFFPCWRTHHITTHAGLRTHHITTYAGLSMATIEETSSTDELKSLIGGYTWCAVTSDTPEWWIEPIHKYVMGIETAFDELDEECPLSYVHGPWWLGLERWK